MRNWILIALCLSLALFSSCISKKKVDLLEQDYLGQLSEERKTNQQLRLYVNDLRQDSIYLKGGNDALLATQRNYLNRLDELEEELDNLNLRASSTAEGKDKVIQEKEAEVRRLKGLLRQADELLSRRLNRLDQVALASRVALSNYDTLLWKVNYNASFCTVVLNEDLMFEKNSTNRIQDSGFGALRDLSDIINRFPELVVDVTGHTDNKPPRQRNLDNWDYSVLRAAAVTRLLTRDFGLSTNQVRACGKGEFSPLISNETSEGQAINRRIELVLRFQESDLVRDLERLLENSQ